MMWPDYRKYLSPEILHIPYKRSAPQTHPSLKKLEESRKDSKQRASMERAVTDFRENFPDNFFVVVVHNTQRNVRTVS